MRARKAEQATSGVEQVHGQDQRRVPLDPTLDDANPWQVLVPLGYDMLWNPCWSKFAFCVSAGEGGLELAIGGRR